MNYNKREKNKLTPVLFELNAFSLAFLSPVVV